MGSLGAKASHVTDKLTGHAVSLIGLRMELEWWRVQRQLWVGGWAWTPSLPLHVHRFTECVA